MNVKIKEKKKASAKIMYCVVVPSTIRCYTSYTTLSSINLTTFLSF